MSAEDLKEAQNLSRDVFEQNLKKEGLELEHDIQVYEEVGHVAMHSCIDFISEQSFSI